MVSTKPYGSFNGIVQYKHLNPPIAHIKRDRAHNKSTSWNPWLFFTAFLTFTNVELSARRFSRSPIWTTATASATIHSAAYQSSIRFRIWIQWPSCMVWEPGCSVQLLSGATALSTLDESVVGAWTGAWKRGERYVHPNLVGSNSSPCSAGLHTLGNILTEIAPVGSAQGCSNVLM